MGISNLPRTISLSQEGNCARIIDQTKLPYELSYIEIQTWERMVDAIKRLEIRGAPALGVAGAAAVSLYISNEAFCHEDRLNKGISIKEGEFKKDHFLENLHRVCDYISNARPTAVNLSWGVNRARNALITALEQNEKPATLCTQVAQEVQTLITEDEACCRSIGTYGSTLLPDNARILTHCNAGSLATAFYGTALGVIYSAFEQGKIAHVYADETRPVGQGARLTAWELAQVGVPATLICDNMAASLMAQGKIDAIVVGADRICANGDTANKIGTYGLAVLARYHHLPFYVAAPTSTLDWTLSEGSAITIEQRNPNEVLPRSITGVNIYNPAFDVTPATMITAFITEKGVISPRKLSSLQKHL